MSIKIIAWNGIYESTKISSKCNKVNMPLKKKKQHKNESLIREQLVVYLRRKYKTQFYSNTDRCFGNYTNIWICTKLYTNNLLFIQMIFSTFSTFIPLLQDHTFNTDKRKVYKQLMSFQCIHK